MRKLFLLILLFSAVLFPEYVQAQVVQSIKVEGATVFSPQEIDDAIAPYLEQELNQQKLQEITAKLTNLYVENGYITSGAFLPEQEIIDGIVIVEVIEGKLKDIEIEGLKRLKEGYINSHFQELTQGIFNTNKLREALESLQVDPFIEKVQAEISESDSISSILLLSIEEASVIQSSLTVNNRASPTIGEVRGVARLSHQNLLGLRERAFVQYDLTEGFSTYEFNYAIPLNYKGTSIILVYRGGESQIIEEPLDDVNIRAETDTFSVKLTQELARSITTESSVSLIFDRSESRLFILKERPFAFPGSPKDGISKLSVLRLKGDWLKRSDDKIIFLRAQISLGVDLLDATINENDPDASFFSWSGQIQYARLLDKEGNIVLISRLGTQLASDSLLSFEKFSLGGATTVRGYRHNRSLGDNGVTGTVAVALKIFEEEGWGRFKLIPFVDVGRVWNNNGGFGQSLASVGLGINWQLRDSLFIGFDWGIPLTEVQKRGESLGDSGVHFSLEWKSSF